MLGSTPKLTCGSDQLTVMRHKRMRNYRSETRSEGPEDNVYRYCVGIVYCRVNGMALGCQMHRSACRTSGGKPRAIAAVPGAPILIL